MSWRHTKMRLMHALPAVLALVGVSFLSVGIRGLDSSSFGINTGVPKAKATGINYIGVIAWGQSNEQGYGKDITPLTQYGYTPTLPFPQFVYNVNVTGLASGNKDAWVKFGTGTGYGPEVSFMNEFMKNYPDGTNFAVLKQTVGGSGIKEWLPAQNKYWPLLQTQVQQANARAAAAGDTITWTVMQTAHGENGWATTYPYLHPEAAPEYSDDFRTFLAAVRGLVGNPNLPVVEARIATDRMTASNVLVPVMQFAGYSNTNASWDGTSVFTTTTTPTNVTPGDWATVAVDGASFYFYTAPVVSVSGNTITLDTTMAVGTPPTASATGRTIKICKASNSWAYPNVLGAAIYRASVQGGPVQYRTLPNNVTVGRTPYHAPVARYWWNGYDSWQNGTLQDMANGADPLITAVNSDGLTVNQNQPAGQPQYWYHTDSAGYVYMGRQAAFAAKWLLGL